jgi:hypothetical protein
VQGRELAHQLEDVSIAGEPVEQDTAGGHWCPQGSAASCQVYPDGKAEPPIGGNDLGIPTLDERTGGCSDALSRTSRGRNQGAESTLAMISLLQQGRRLGITAAPTPGKNGGGPA